MMIGPGKENAWVPTSYCSNRAESSPHPPNPRFVERIHHFRETELPHQAWAVSLSAHIQNVITITVRSPKFL